MSAPTSAPPARKRWRVLLVVLLILVVLPVLLVAAGWIFVHSSRGEALVRDKVLAAVSDALAGKLEAEKIELNGDHVVLLNVKLFTPEGELVVSIERVEADVELTELVGKRLHLEQVQVQTPKLLLKEDERGWNLLRAVALKTAPVTAASTGPGGWRLEFEDVELTDGLFDFQQEGRRITAEKLALKGNAKVRLEPLEVTGEAELSSRLVAPLEETLQVKVAAVTAKGPQRYDLSLDLGGTRLRGRMELPALALTIDELVAAPRELKAFIPAWPLLPVVSVKGSLSPRQAALQLTAGKARASVDAKYELENSSAQTLLVKGSNIDLQELVGASLPSVLAFDATGTLADWHPETLGGALTANATWDTKDARRLASAHLSVTAAKGALEVQTAEVTSPGLALSAHGTASTENLKAFATLDAKDLRLLAGTLRAFVGVELPGLAGHGKVRVSFSGPPRGPEAHLVGELKAFSIAGVQAELVEFNADVPDVSEPLETDVLLHAQRLHLGERAFEDVTFDLITHGRELDLDLATKGLGDIGLHAMAILDKDTRGAELQKLQARSDDVSWGLEEPTRITWVDGVSIAPFAVRDDQQRISGEFVLQRSKLDGKLLIERLDLGKIPRVFVLPSLGLGGLLSANATVTGLAAKPSVTLHAQLADGKVKSVEAMQVGLDGTWADDRAKGTLKLESKLGALAGTFDVPVLAFLGQRPGQGSAHFAIKGVPVKQLAQQLEHPLPLEGLLSGVVDLSGSGDHPKVRVTVASDELTLTGEDALRLGIEGAEVAAFTTDAATLEATLRFTTLGAESTVTLSTPLTIASLRQDPPTLDELLSLPVKLQLDVKHLNLKKLDEAHLVHDDELAGTVTLAGTLTGSVKAPLGKLELTCAEVTYPPLRKASAQFTLTTDPGHTRLAATASLAEQQQAIELTAAVSALPEKALAALLGPKGSGDAVVDALREVPVELLVVLKPFPLSQAVVSHEGHTTPGGVLSATLEASGTLEAPTARLLGSLKDLRFDRVALGSGRFDLRSTGTEQRFTVALGGEGRDDFKAKGTLGLDLRVSALRHGLAWRTAPLDISLESRNFDLGFLSGSTDLLRVVAGRMDLTGHVTGQLGDPHFVGDAVVRAGRLALAGLGDYRDIGLDLHAEDNLVEVKKLTARSGAGGVDLVARAVRQPSGAFSLTSTGNSDKFPLVFDDQLQASISLHYVLSGDVTSALVDIKKLELTQVVVALPEVRRKDLQNLQRPKDIIILRAGDRATRRRRQEAKDGVISAQTATPLVIRARIDAPRNIWVRSSDLNVELGLSDDFRVEFNEDLRLFGDVRLIKGSVEVIGREFTVQRGSEARFAGSPVQPYVNLSALHVNSREQVKITVTVAGRGTDLGFKVSSEPPMPESDIYAVLATGRRNLKSSGGATLSPGQAASVVGQLAASQLKTVIAKKLPIDVFNFDTSDNFEKVKLDVGKYLSDIVYLGASVDIGAKRERGENVWAGRLELQVTKSISLEAYAGDALSFGADAMWSRDF